MNQKRVFGTVLTVLGIGGLGAAAFMFVNGGTTNYNIKALITYGILGFVFFISGIGLIRTTSDNS